MNTRAWNRSLLVASLIAGAIFGVSVWMEWYGPERPTTSVSLLALALILGAAGVSYALRIIRFYVILLQSGIRVSLRNTALAQAVGFALSVTPGSVGEIFKLHLIQERSGTPLLKSAPALLLDRGMEAVGFVTLAILSAVLLPSLPSQVQGIPFYAFGLVLFVSLILLWRRTRGMPTIGRRLLNKFSATRRMAPSIQSVWSGMETRVTSRQVIAGLALTALARIADGLVLLLAAQMLGVALALPVAILVIALSGFAGGMSLLPGGAGATETTMAGLLMFSGAPFASALAITLLARMSTLWFWVGLGLGIAMLVQLHKAKHTLSSR